VANAAFGVLAVDRNSLEWKRFSSGTDAYGVLLSMQLKPLPLGVCCVELCLKLANAWTKHDYKAPGCNALGQTVKEILDNSYNTETRLYGRICNTGSVEMITTKLLFTAIH
jgi:hypothetical protein